MIQITFNNGAFISWGEEQYTDYMYDGKCFIVIKNDKWVGIYNISIIRSVEIDK